MEKPLDKERGKSGLQDQRPNLTSCKTLPTRNIGPQAAKLHLL